MTRDGEAGFTVLETLVAMTILALTLAIASQSIVLAARSLAAARNQTNAMLRIRGQLTGLETSGPGVGAVRRRLEPAGDRCRRQEAGGGPDRRERRFVPDLHPVAE